MNLLRALPRQRMKHITSAVEGAYGEVGRQAVPYRSADAQDNGAIVNQSETMESQLLNFDFPEPEGDAESSALAIMPPRETLVTSLKSRREKFSEARTAYDATLQNLVAVQAEYDAALEAFNEQERRVRGLLKAFLHFAGLEELASVLRLERRGSQSNSQNNNNQGGNDPPTSEGDPPFSQIA